ncbi:cytochrome P450 [Colletotrichum truncatum]|uniref:Cytochrome P450 n=1 Tax=Colletotrichum truncatum TaxID=5467 RepID=A0ACC3ZFQ6_COLTU
MTTKFEPIPQPPTLPIIGNLTDIDSRNFNESMVDLVKKYGPIYRLTVAGESFVVVSSWKLVDEELRAATNDGLFTSRGEEEVNWGIAHRVLMSAFGPISIRNMFDEMHEIGTQLALKWSRQSPSQRLDIGEDFTRLALDTVALCSMGFRFNSYYREDLHPFTRAMYEVLKAASKRSMRFLPSIFYHHEDRRFAENIKLLRSTAQEVLDARRKLAKEAVDARKDLLTQMLSGVDPKTGRSMTDESIIDNLITFLIAGHETTASTLQFIMYNLLTHPEAYRKAQQELDAIVGTSALTPEHIPKLKYLNAVIRETLRLSSPISMFARQPLKDEVLGGKYAIKADTQLVCFLGMSHRDPNVYGQTAEEFHPERMLDENFNRIQEEFPHSWSPFGTGIRGCIGRPFAWQEMMIACGILLQNFNFLMDDPTYTLQISESITIKPKGFYVKAIPRNGMSPSQLEARLSGAYNGTYHSTVREQESASEPLGQQTNNNDSHNKIAIYYGSDAGTCEFMAQKLASNAVSHGYHASIDQLDAARESLPKGIPVVIITSTYEGQPPQNARHFVQWIESLKGVELEGITFAVYGCGHSDWVKTFQRTPKLIDSTLQKLGAERLTSAGQTNVKERDTFSDFEAWEDNFLWPAIVKRFGDIKIQINATSALQVALSTPRVLSLRQKVKEALVTDARRLSKGDASDEKRHLELQLPSGMSYTAGDYIAVLPCNPKSSVDRVMRRFHLAWDVHVFIKATGPTTLPLDVSVPLYYVLNGYVELGQVATKRDIAILAQHTDNEELREKLIHMSGDGFETLVRGRALSILDVLESHPTLRLPLQHFLSMLPPMATRHSISSSPLAEAGKVTLTYNVLNEPALSGVGQYTGVASNYLSSLSVGDKVQVTVRPAAGGFRLPLKAEETPLILIAAGTGIAPFRAFVQERAIRVANGQTVGPAMLFYGCRHPEMDDLYREEFDDWESKGIVTVLRAYSRKPAASSGCSYVQNRLWLERESVGRLWSKEARIYVCGSNKIETSAKVILVKIIQDESMRHGRPMSDEAAQEWFENQRNERFTTDVFD